MFGWLILGAVAPGVLHDAMVYDAPDWQRYVAHYVQASPELSKTVLAKFHAYVQSLALSNEERKALRSSAPSVDLLEDSPEAMAYHIAYNSPVVYVGVGGSGKQNDNYTYVCSLLYDDQEQRLVYYPEKYLQVSGCVKFYRDTQNEEYAVPEGETNSDCDER